MHISINSGCHQSDSVISKGLEIQKVKFLYELTLEKQCLFTVTLIKLYKFKLNELMIAPSLFLETLLNKIFVFLTNCHVCFANRGTLRSF
jgi:hypothetical protein